MTVLTRVIARLLLPSTLITAIAVLVKGYGDVGDGFSAAVIAAFGVLLQYVAFGHRAAARALPLRAMPAVSFAGLLLALLVTFGPVLRGQAPLAHSPAPGADVIYLGTLELHTALVFDLGVFLLVFGFAVGAIDLIAGATDRERGQGPL